MDKSLLSETSTAGALPRLLCLFNRHEPADRRVNWNGETYLSICEYCGAPIFRLKRGRWRRDRRKSRRL